MTINAQGYFNALQSYLNLAEYEAACAPNGDVVMRETIFVPGNQRKTLTVRLTAPGDALVIKLDVKTGRKGNQSEPLFHFLDDNGKPWSKRCDFVVFHLHHGSLGVLCFEFKWESLPVGRIIAQLAASESWCRSLHSVVKHYTAKKRSMNLTKYVLSAHPDPTPYVDASGYLKRDHSIRHYHYHEIDGVSLHELENTNIEKIR